MGKQGGKPFREGIFMKKLFCLIFVLLLSFWLTAETIITEETENRQDPAFTPATLPVSLNTYSRMLAIPNVTAKAVNSLAQHPTHSAMLVIQLVTFVKLLA